MGDILQDVLPWYREGTRFAVATLVRTWSSSPMPIGTAMAVCEAGEVIGSVSGGCVEGAVYVVAQEVMDSGHPQLVTYGVSDGEALSVGLTCGGTMELFVQPVDTTVYPHLAVVADAVAAHQQVAVATVVAGGLSLGLPLVITSERRWGSLGGERLDQAVTDDARGMLSLAKTGLQLGSDGQRRAEDLSVFVQSYAPPPRMIVFGAIDVAVATARIGKFLGYHVTVCDARPVFATSKRFPGADEVVVAWPHKYLAQVEVDERTVLCVLTHDPKFDVPFAEIGTAHQGRLHRRSGQPAHSPGSAETTARGRDETIGAGQNVLPDRPGPWRRHPPRDRRRDRRRDHCPDVGRHRPTADGHEPADPQSRWLVSRRRDPLPAPVITAALNDIGGQA